jgi:hypothetical protein
MRKSHRRPLPPPDLFNPVVRSIEARCVSGFINRPDAASGSRLHILSLGAKPHSFNQPRPCWPIRPRFIKLVRTGIVRIFLSRHKPAGWDAGLNRSPQKLFPFQLLSPFILALISVHWLKTKKSAGQWGKRKTPQDCREVRPRGGSRILGIKPGRTALPFQRHAHL